MSLRALVMRQPSVASWFMTHAPESLHARAGANAVAKTVRDAVTRTKAYPVFLAEHGVDPETALDPAHFASLPITSKANYLDRFSLSEVCLDGDPSASYTIEKSSGTSGRAYYWLRTREEDAETPSYLEFTFRHFFRIHEVPTLMVVGLALGMWTAGEKMAHMLREIAAHADYPMTVVAPGINTDEILETVADLAPYFGQTVLIGYPPFIKSVVDEGSARGMDWQSFKVRAALGGEGFSEAWRAHLGAKLGIDTARDLLGISGGYAAADLGMAVGREFPLTVLVRQLCESDESLTRDLFGGSDVPNLSQFNPAGCFAEEVDGQLVFTNSSGIPVVRYRIGDTGGVHAFDDVMRVLDDHGYDAVTRLLDLGYRHDEIWPLPFLHIFGRTDGTVFVGGLNVYPDNINAVIAEMEEAEFAGFKLATTKGEDEFTDRLLILLEHRDPTLSGLDAARIADEYAPRIAEGLRRVNREYRRLSEAAPSLAEPVIRVYAAGHGPFAQDIGKVKRKYVA